MQEKFSKRKAYREAIEAFHHLSNPSQDSSTILKHFQGFGGLKELLLPLDNLTSWNNEDLKYRKEVEAIHAFLHDFYGARYQEALNSIRNSVLTSFFTPNFLIKPLIENLGLTDQPFKKILEPSAGRGNFIPFITETFPQAEVTAVEKDDITFQILKSSFPEVRSIHSGFEALKEKGFDLIISNIPFGSLSVYDSEYLRSSDSVKAKSTSKIHNYFFIRGLESLNEGGILAFITSSGVMDSPANRDIREHLMRSSHLVTAVRFPNTVFEASGTYPVTDLIILKKDSQKASLTNDQKLFINSVKITLQNTDRKDVELNVSEFFKENKDNVYGNFVVGGQYGREALDVESSDQEDEISKKNK